MRRFPHRGLVSSRRFLQANNISFHILDDGTGDVAIKFGIRWPPDDFRAIPGLLGTDLISFRDTETWSVPMQARYVIGRDSVIAFAEVAFDNSKRSELTEILPVLDRLMRSP